ncbi:MAG: hypothetical protein IJM59_12690 [Proteobacteria bacterium]|nr:hypothetical protein [Pseudomonadota bacterium]
MPAPLWPSGHTRRECCYGRLAIRSTSAEWCRIIRNNEERTDKDDDC